ncbi:MAG: AmmeMemoRadiSam system protein B [Candidatus Aminicenantia bacterium]
MTQIRKPAVAGQFYPKGKDSLLKVISNFINEEKEKRKCLAMISPHAGYMYSGKVAGETFSTVFIPDSVLLLGPNHTGLGKTFAIMDKGIWETPLGDVEINEELATIIINESDLVRVDPSAHSWEHSLEVQLPFIKYFNPNVTFVPICIQKTNYEQLKKFGEEIAEAIKRFGKDLLIVASSDMSHYVPQEEAKIKDWLALEKIESLNPYELYKIVEMENISMCGIAPVVSTLSACLKLGASKAQVVNYATSGDVSGDYSEVVGYAGIIIF